MHTKHTQGSVKKVVSCERNEKVVLRNGLNLWRRYALCGAYTNWKASPVPCIFVPQ